MEEEGKMKCMKCKKLFDSCICFKSKGQIPEIWYCKRCYGEEETKQKVLDLIKKMMLSHHPFIDGMTLQEKVCVI